jgi:hypothetical protein
MAAAFFRGDDKFPLRISRKRIVPKIEGAPFKLSLGGVVAGTSGRVRKLLIFATSVNGETKSPAQPELERGTLKS